MNIAMVGNFGQTWHTESHVARDLEGLGHTVTRVESLELYDADLLLIQGNGGGWLDVGYLRDVESSGCTTASYHLDLFVGLARQSRVGVETMWQTQHVFTPDGDPNSQQFFTSKGINHHWLPPACVSDECVPGTWRDEYDFDVVFVGASNYHAEHPWRVQLIRALRKRYGRRFGLFDHHPPVRDHDLNDLYATARVVVGDSLCLPGHTRYVSDRLFETLGRGGFLIFPDVPGLDEFGFVDGEHLRYYQYGDAGGLYALIDYYLDHPDKARAIAERGQAFVRAHHTYKHRVQEMFRVLELESVGVAPV